MEVSIDDVDALTDRSTGKTSVKTVTFSFPVRKSKVKAKDGENADELKSLSSSSCTDSIDDSDIMSLDLPDSATSMNLKTDQITSS